MITDLERTGGLLSALRRNRSARVRPPTPRAPTRRNSRREIPSHIRLAIGLLRKVNMAYSFDGPFPDRRLPGPWFRVFKQSVLRRRVRSNAFLTRMNS